MRFPSILKRLLLASGLYHAADELIQATFRRGRRRRALADTAFFSAVLAPGALCFDVGANVGEKTLAMLRTRAHVVAFEPQPELGQILRARCAGQGDLAVIPVAVGAAPDLLPMHVSVYHTMSSLRADWLAEPSACANLVVPVVTLDQAIEVFGVPYYVKIDVEGYEWEVLQGLSQLPALLSFEYHLADPRRNEVDRCITRLAELGRVEVNVTPAETLRFHLSPWLGPEAFLAWFSADRPQSQAFEYGDIFVRRLNS